MTMAAIQREREHIGRINNGNNWAEALYWDGKRLKCLNDCPLSWGMSEALFTLGFYKAIDIEMV